VISLGTAGVGLVAIGCMAVGVKAFAWLSALGWVVAASGGFSIARGAAEGVSEIEVGEASDGVGSEDGRQVVGVALVALSASHALSNALNVERIHLNDFSGRAGRGGGGRRRLRLGEAPGWQSCD
jgi:hypothetical protein